MRCFLPLLLPAFVLAACSSVVPSSLVSLAATSPLKADPDAIAVALVVPPGLAITPGTAEMKIDIARADTGEHRVGRYILIDAPATMMTTALAPDETLHVYQLDAKDAQAVRLLQTELAQRETEVQDGKGSASLSLGIGGCRVGEGPARNATASAFIRTDAAGVFLPLIDQQPLDSLLGAEASGTLKPCP